MKIDSISRLCPAQARKQVAQRLGFGARGVVLSSLLSAAFQVSATTALSNSPVLATTAVPGNVALALSVEYPTAVRSAHTGAYATASTFLGYFDPNKCYAYRYYAPVAESAALLSHFYPVGANTAHNCTAAGQWSGNYLNWASAPTIDPFRWAMTGGYRVIDTTTDTILQKARRTNQDMNLTPDKAITGATVAAATPWAYNTLNTRINNFGTGLNTGINMLFSDAGLSNTVFDYDPAVAVVPGRTYRVAMRVKVCDSSAAAGGVEANCRQYGNSWKPEGLMQTYSTRLRFSAFGYLNDSTGTRDGGVLRAQQKFVGPLRPVPGEPAVTNTATEWDPITGIFYRNPDATDALQTNADFIPNSLVVDSGAINYLNKFGQLNTSDYKGLDPVSELYYTALRYFKNQGPVPSYSTMSTGATAAQYLDNFPVITRWNDPIQYSCQKNFVLGIGDIYTHLDKNLPGNSGRSGEPALPALVGADHSFNVPTGDVTTWTNRAFALQGLGNPNPDNYSGRNNSAGIVGMAYYANTTDIRPDIENPPNSIGQTIQTFWVDVLEAPFVSNNQFYLAAKYGGFSVPTGYAAGSRTAALPQALWSTNGDTLATNQPRPDNYYTGGRPDTLVSGLTDAFERIANASNAFTTSFSTSVPQVATQGNGSYSSQYNADNWSGEILASSLSFDVNGNPTLTPAWSATERLATQLAGAGWDTNRRVVTWNGSPTTGAARGVPFRATSLNAAQLAALDTPYDATDDSTRFLNYLRGNRANEAASTVAATPHVYRNRTQLLGDIVGSRARPVAGPSLPLSDGTNPGYGAYRSEWANRGTVVYAGANDGMLHAFDGALTGATRGREIFAYVPSAVFAGPDNTPAVSGLASLGRSPLNHRYLVNATPTVFDIDLGRTYNGTAIGNTTDWRSVLIGGLGKGGRSYYAIDVTNPASFVNPGNLGDETAAARNVLWEFTAPQMGFTFGEPAVVKTRKYGWTVILPSGYNTPDGRGYFFFLNPRTGELLEAPVSTGVGSVANDAGLAQLNAYVLDYTDGYADAVYAGDLLGNIWRVDLTGDVATVPYPAPLRLAVLTDRSGVAQPVTSRPVIELYPRTLQRTVLVGTGRLLDPSDIASTQEQTFYAIADGNSVAFNTTATLPAGVTFPIDRNELVANTNLQQGYAATTQAPMGWYFDLGRDAQTGIAWRVITDAATFTGTVSFAPTLPNGSVCTPGGGSRLYGVDFSNGRSLLLNSTGGFISSIDDIVGVITDSRFVSVDGTVRLVVGSDRGGVQNAPGNFTTPVGLRRLNWREIPISN